MLTDVLGTLAAYLSLKEDNQRLRVFAETAAHDLKAPLRGISQLLEFMREEDFDPDVVRETHGLAARAAHRLAQVTSGLLEPSVLGKTDFSRAPVKLCRIACEARDLLRAQIAKSRARIRINDLPAAHVNEDLMLRVFLNLMGNSLRYRRQDRPVEIEVSLLRETNDTLAISFADNGIGIPKDSAQTVFEPLHRLHRQNEVEGSGLGLAICNRIINLHQGSISVDTAVRGGTQILIRLPKSSAGTFPIQAA